MGCGLFFGVPSIPYFSATGILGVLWEFGLLRHGLGDWVHPDTGATHPRGAGPSWH